MGVSSNPSPSSAAVDDPLLSSSPNPCYGIPVEDPPAAYVILPFYRRSRRRGCRRQWCSSIASSSSLLTLAFVLLLLVLSIFFLFPSDPDVSVVRLHLHHLRVSTFPLPRLDISLSLKIKIRNRNFFSLDYRSLVVSIGYRGKNLGSMNSDGGSVRARGVSYVDAELKLDGIRIIGDVFYLIEDLAKGSVPFDTVTEVDGQLHLLFLDIPVDGKISCEVNVNPDNQTVVRQNCFPE